MVGLLHRENCGNYHIPILILVPASFRLDSYRELLGGVPGIPRQSVNGAPPIAPGRLAEEDKCSAVDKEIEGCKQAYASWEHE